MTWNLDHETMDLPDGSGLSIVVYSAPPASAAEDGLKLLASWAATAGRAQNVDTESHN
ncbi:hypothetical protein [Streptomyces sp. NPDC091294]|uniref:hypothetical protein n=1 Tax=Streptomyces sp. NPDC091294 TaxID=3365992 RepID=UPI00380EF024